ncbi:LysM peptidoglycan-binding domain-containing protein [Ktedonosporobacter rubrisoli]|uniref:LysM peptidoglycan-binding domain-containing protein n=1 Tax=Ktedonosporobacter rubrisoli TaxID=2509675 RepID=A0A4P6JR09_KTERU|nr:transglycosylase SLT domain-containing protein [Ktedonosporobacter rubrisoli]QBD77785.1 LysM peptidoglycan-binding domain-containing protein [Ktedonosporobacter rubrisoli]
MMNTPIQEFAAAHTIAWQGCKDKLGCLLPQPFHRQIVLLALTLILFFGSVVVSQRHPDVYAANPGYGNVCTWYKVRPGDTLGRIARNNRTTAASLARANNIRNINLIFIHQQLCIPRPAGNSHTSLESSSGLHPNGSVRWYAYNALDWSSRQEVSALLQQAARYYGLPVNLLYAIAWQESGWNQHIIARDGGIGTMQIMPYTAMSINASTGIRRDPYKLSDNIYMGATYLRWLWSDFHGDLSKVISAYNEGGWSVVHRGIFNWPYVSSVLALMRQFN